MSQNRATFRCHAAICIDADLFGMVDNDQSSIAQIAEQHIRPGPDNARGPLRFPGKLDDFIEHRLRITAINALAGPPSRATVYRASGSFSLT